MPGACRHLNARGVILLSVSAIVFAVMAVLVRIAGQLGVPASESTFARFAFGLITVGFLHLTGKGQVRLRRTGLLVARGVLGGTAILLYFLSLSASKGPEAVPLTNSVFLGNSYFIYTPIFGAVFIGERLRWTTVLSVLAALAGLYLVANPDLSDLRLGNVYGFLSGIVAAVAIVILRELRKTENAISIFLSLCVFGALLGLAMMVIGGSVWPSAIGWLLLVGIGITATIGQLSLTYALRFAEAGEGSIIQMSSVVYSSAAGILWFGDPFTLRVAIGALWSWPARHTSPTTNAASRCASEHLTPVTL